MSATLTLTTSRRKVACSLCGKRVSVPRDQMDLVTAANQHSEPGQLTVCNTVDEALERFTEVPVGEPGQQQHETVIVCDACWTTASSGSTP